VLGLRPWLAFLRRARILRLTVRFDMAREVTGAVAGAINLVRSLVVRRPAAT